MHDRSEISLWVFAGQLLSNSDQPIIDMAFVQGHLLLVEAKCVSEGLSAHVPEALSQAIGFMESSMCVKNVALIQSDNFLGSMR